jgi:hypothetical protein
MTSLHQLLNTVRTQITHNSPLILTAFGVSGTIATAYLAGKASFEAAERLAFEQAKYTDTGIEYQEHLEFKEKVRVVWKLYIPATGMAVLTIGSIIFAHRIGSRRAAAVAAAYSISEKAFAEYKEKVIEKMGKNKERAVRDEIAQDTVDRHPVSKNEIHVANGGKVLFYDAYTARYFESDMETVKKAANDVNYTILHNNYASLSDFYDRIGLNHTTTSDDIGWNLDHELDLVFSTTMSEDQKPCIVINFTKAPIANFYKAFSMGS